MDENLEFQLFLEYFKSETAIFFFRYYRVLFLFRLTFLLSEMKTLSTIKMGEISI